MLCNIIPGNRQIPSVIADSDESSSISLFVNLYVYLWDVGLLVRGMYTQVDYIRLAE